MSERPQLQPALGLVKDRLAGPPPRRTPDANTETTPEPSSAQNTAENSPSPDADTQEPARDDQADRTETPAPSTRPAAPRRARRATAARTSDASDGGVRRTTVSIPQNLAEALRERLQTERGLSQAQFILNAIEANAHRLTDLVAAERPTPVSGGGLFPDQRPGRVTGEARTTLNFDTTERNLQVVDTLVAHHHADSRSHLVRVALRAALD